MATSSGELEDFGTSNHEGDGCYCIAQCQDPERHGALSSPNIDYLVKWMPYLQTLQPVIFLFIPARLHSLSLPLCDCESRLWLNSFATRRR